MSISSEITRLSGNVSDALTAIANKGVTVPSGSNSDDLATLIAQISGGGGGTGAIVINDSADSHGGIIREITAVDISDTTATASDVINSKWFYTADGTRTQGTGSGGITPTGNINITQSGQTDVTNYATATVSSGTLISSIEYIDDEPSVSVNSSGVVNVSGGLSTDVSPVTTSGWINSSTTIPVEVGVVGTYQLDTQAATTITPTTSSQTAVAAGKYTTGAVTVAAMPSGSAGTPTATKGTVSNHSIAVTPSVTNTTGYITGSTINGTAVTVSASELVSGSETKTVNGTYDVTNLAELVVNVSGTSKNTQVIQATTRVQSTSLTKASGEITVSKTGTYHVYWSTMRSNTSSGYTWGSQLYVGGSAYGSENTSGWSNNVQNIHLQNVSLTANQKIQVYARGRSGSYYAYVPTLVIVEA